MKTDTPHDVALRLVRDIDAFDRATSHDGYTDTGVAWELLHLIRRELWTHIVDPQILGRALQARLDEDRERGAR